ncbi:hypothetical protein BJX66DRAFT_302532 [Aspergillus keveii]|uniref:Uncharacterized protein n=1 Tax=Aspergillus keveii TaxID=714993 RepID=A0ABR4G7Q3_9EURO
MQAESPRRSAAKPISPLDQNQQPDRRRAACLGLAPLLPKSSTLRPLASSHQHREDLRIYI